MIDCGVEARIGIGVVHNEAFAGGEHEAGDAGGARDAQLGQRAALRHIGEELVALLVVQEDAAAVGRERVGGELEKALQKLVERKGLEDTVYYFCEQETVQQLAGAAPRRP